MEAVCLTQDVDTHGFDPNDTINHGDRSQPFKRKTEENVVIQGSVGNGVSRDNYQPMEDGTGDMEPMLKDPSTDLASTESKVDLEGEAAMSGNHRIWHLAYYQRWFDITTEVALTRLTHALCPWKNEAFNFHSIYNKPDLYCPFWVVATLAFLIATMSNITK